MKIKIISKIVYILVRLISFTYRYEFRDINLKKLSKEDRKDRFFTYAIWHQNIVPGLFAHNGESFSMIISESKDGELIAQICTLLGHKPARGSSSRGGQKALRELVHNINNGHPGCITVDGPRGPAHTVKFGIIDVAKLTGAPIVPLSPYPDSFWSFNKSWDKFRFPRPFSKTILIVGEPLYISRDLKKENYEEMTQAIAAAIHLGEKKAIECLKNQS